MTDTLALHTFHGIGFMGIVMYRDCDCRNGAFNLDVINADFVGSSCCHSGFDCLRELCFAPTFSVVSPSHAPLA